MKKWIAGALAALLLLTAAAVPAAAAGKDSPPAEPEVVVAANCVDEKTLELSLRVCAAQFQTVGAVLQYDRSKLELIEWDGETRKPIPVTGTDWSGSAAVHTLGADGLAGKPALAYADEGGKIGFLYLGADSLQSVALQESTAVVTVRFAYVGDTKPADVTVPVTDAAEGGFTIDFAPEAVVALSIPGAQVFYTADADTQYAQGYDGTTSAKALTASFRFVEESSADTSGSGGGGGYAITFFDWDGRVIDAVAAEGNAAAAVAALESKYKDSAAVDGYVANGAKPLTDKKGYVFNGWLPVRQTDNGLTATDPETLERVFPAAQTAAEFGKAKADFSNVRSNLLVMAAYVENEKTINAGLTDATRAYYTVDVEHAVYTRYGSASATDGKYSITLTVSRQNSKQGGVARLREPVVFVVMKPDAKDPTQNIISRIDLENTDQTTFEVVPTRKIERVEVKLIDPYGVAAWPAAGDCSATSGVDSTTFVKMGSWGFVRDWAIQTLEELGDSYADTAQWPSAWKNDADEATFTDGGLKLNGKTLEAAKGNILTAMKPLNDAQRRAVTAADLQSMIDSSYTA